MNRWIGHGNVGKDPEVRTTPAGKKVASFSFATSEHRRSDSGEKITDTTWHNIVAWEKLAELAEKYVKKGSSLIVEGRISNRSYDDKNGVKKYISEIIATGIHFTGGKKETETKPEDKQGEWQGTKAMSNTEDLPGAEETNIPGYVPIGDDKDLPF